MTVYPGSLVTEDGGQDLSNKTLINPTITGSTRINNIESDVSTLQSEVNALQAIDHSHGFTILSRNDSITPVANTPTSKTISGFGLDSGTYNAFISANTTVVGNVVTGVATTEMTNSSGKIWVFRTNTTATNVDVLIVQSADPIN